jgi:DNA-binding response OmpR family regulator
VQTPRIAVIEDDHAIAAMYEMKLRGGGFEVRVASDGVKGLELSESFKPDLILLDIKMPGMTGDEMLERLRTTQWGSKVRVLVLTNVSRDEAPMKLRFLNVERYIVKAHHTPGQVVEIVKEVLRT